MTYTYLKTAALMFSASALLVLSGCDGTTGTASDHQLVGNVIPPVQPPVVPPVQPPVVPPVVPPILPPSNTGKVFHIVFMENYDTSGSLILYISSEKETDVNITLSDDNSSFVEHIIANESKEVIIDTRMMQSGTAIENKMIEVTSDENIVVVGLNRVQFTTDAFLALPDQVLSNDYRVATYDALSSLPEQFSIIALEDNTTVNYRLMDNSTGEVILNKGQTYQYQSTTSLTGAHLNSDKNFAVHSGNVCTNVPSSVTACDHLVEQMLPVNTWEKEFITVPLKTRLGGDTFRIIASADNTSLKVNGTEVATLSAGEYHEMILEGSNYITADSPILVLQYSNGTSYDGVTSDPFMTIVPAVNQYDTRHVIQTPVGFTNYVNIVVLTANTGDILLDGVEILSSEFTAVSGNTAYSAAQIQIDEGTHILSSSVPFGLVGYGFADFDSYGYPSSLKLTKH